MSTEEHKGLAQRASEFLHGHAAQASQPARVPVLPLAYASAARTLREGNPLLGEVCALLDAHAPKDGPLMAPNGGDFLGDAEGAALGLLQYLAGLRHLGVKAADLQRMRRLQALCGVVFNELVEVLSIALRAAGDEP